MSPPPSTSSRNDRRATQEASRRKKSLEMLTADTCELILVRHGETDWNAEHRLQGQLFPGPSLNTRGQLQSVELATRLEEIEIHAIYTSDLARTVETVDEIKKSRPSVPITVTIELRERNLGVLQGLTMADARAMHPETVDGLRVIGNLNIPGGVEPLSVLQERIKTALETIAGAHSRCRVLIVTHGGALRAAYQQATASRSAARLSNCALCTLRIDPTQSPPAWAIVNWGDTAHLTQVDAHAFGGGLAG